MIDPPRIANLLSAGQHNLNYFVRKRKIKCVKCVKCVISGPGHSTRRRRLQTLNAAKMLHLGTAENMTPAYAGLMAVLNGSAMKCNDKMC